MCQCGCNPCCGNFGNSNCNHGCDTNHEGLQSQVSNLVNLVYGSVTKQCVNNQVVWTEPCNLAAGLNACFPRIAGEGTLCYIMRILQDVVVLPSGTWSSAVSYCRNSSVIYSGNSYVSLVDSNINHQPDVSPTYWRQF